MLDQNTDRMWFVIGAVIVGAAIIFIANGTLPDVFASVAESFQESSDKATVVVDKMYVGVIPELRAYGDAKFSIAGYPEVLQISTSGPSGVAGVYFDTSKYEVNSTYELSFEFEKISGSLFNMAGHTGGFWADHTYYLDDVEQGRWYNSHWNKKQSIDDFSRHSVRVVFNTGDDASRITARNEVENHLFIQPNRGVGNSPVTVNIYNLKLEKIK